MTARLRITTDDGSPIAWAGVADGPVSRAIGLLRHRRLEPGEGLLLVPARLLHTWFMRFPIGVAFLDRAGCVVAVADPVPPFCVCWGGWRSRVALEVPAGHLTRLGVRPGMRLGLRCPP